MIGIPRFEAKGNQAKDRERDENEEKLIDYLID
jgi:hypothetical protein